MIRRLAVFLMILLLTSPSHAVEVEKARTLVKTAVDEGISTFVAPGQSLTDRTRSLDSLLRRYSDGPLLSQFILGRYWSRIEPEAQKAFTETFLRYLVSSYVGLLKNLDSGLSVQIGQASDLGGGRVRVASMVTLPSEPGKPIPVDWDVADAADGRPVVLDVTAEGVSIIKAMRDDFSSVLRSSGGKVDPLMDALARKIAENDRLNTEK